MRGKAGASHFEMIIGFVFFIGFVMFLFLFLSPWDNSSLPNSALAGLHISFLEEVSVDLSSVFIKTTLDDEDSEVGCFSIELPSNIFEYVDTDEAVSRVTRLGGASIASELVNKDLTLGAYSNFFRIAISPEFSSGDISPCAELPGSFELGSVVEMQIVSSSKLAIMRNRYYSDYDGLKEDLKLADIFDFAIVFVDSPSKNMEPAIETSDVVEVLAKEYIIKILGSSGEVSNERISIQVW